MRKTLIAIALVGGLTGCSAFKRTLGVGDSSPAHTPPGSTSIWGDWVLGSSPDSTAFVGASSVQMRLDQSSFTITANYPARSPVTITGAVTVSADGGLVTLEPRSGLEGTGGGAFGWTPGERVTVVASAAGGTLLFAPPRDALARPTSVWHRKDVAQKAGIVPPPAP